MRKTPFEHDVKHHYRVTAKKHVKVPVRKYKRGSGKQPTKQIFSRVDKGLKVTVNYKGGSKDSFINDSFDYGSSLSKAVNRAVKDVVSVSMRRLG